MSAKWQVCLRFCTNLLVTITRLRRGGWWALRQAQDKAVGRGEASLVFEPGGEILQQTKRVFVGTVKKVGAGVNDCGTSTA